MPFIAGELVGPYRILEQLGQGGMATVYKAYHAALDRYVAIKALHPALLQEPNFLARFQREAKVVARLEHTHIVPIYDYSEYEGRPYLVMRYIEGETLKSRLGQERLRQEEILLIVERIGAALEYAHHAGVLHRDVKPSNVLLGTDGQTYLADFGLARIASSGESTLSADVMVGTPHYISPEQALGASGLDEGTDIYSFGVLLYELFVGRVPFNADTPFSIIHDHIYAPLPLPRSLNPHISPEIEKVLLKALAKERKDRFSDVRSMVEAFQGAMAGLSLDDVQKAANEPDKPGLVPPPDHSIDFTAKDSRISLHKQTPITSLLNIQHGKTQKWLGPGMWVLVVCLCGLIALGGAAWAFRAYRANRQASMITPSSTQVASLDGDALRIPPDPTISAKIADLEQQLIRKPGDPNIHFDLSIAYLDAGMTVEAKAEFELAMQYAGKDVQFYHRAGEILLDHEAWLEAARAMIESINLSSEPITRKSLDQLSQAIYMAADDPRILDYVSTLRKERIRPPIVDVVRARHFLYRGDVSQTEEIISNLRSRIYQIPETDLLQAEVSLKKGDVEAAILQFSQLAANQDISDWIRAVARNWVFELKSTDVP